MAVDAAVSKTATSISIRRERSTLTPSAQALSSPISSSRMRLTSSSAPINIRIISGAAGQVFPHVRPLREPAYHSPAESAVSSDACSRSQVLNAISIARMPIPMMIRRKVSMPLRQASAQISNDVRMPPAIAVKVIAVRC